MDDGVREGKTGEEGRGGSRLALGVNLGLVTLVAWSLVRAWTQLGGNRPRAALNLLQRREEVLAWFSGAPVYEALPTAVYPPGSLALLWPLVGAWGSTRVVLALYAALSVGAAVMLVWTSAFAVAGDAVPTHRTLESGRAAWIGLLLLLPWSVSHGLGLGQLHLLVLVLGVGAVMRARRATDWRGSAVAGLLLALALIKPSAGAGFLVLALVWSWRSAVVAGGVHVVATGLALAARDEPPLRLLEQWWFRATEGARFGAAEGGYGSVHDLVGVLGVPQLAGFATLAVLGAGGIWLWRHRDANPWLLVGVAGLVGRFATYHRAYDDVLVLPALAAVMGLAVRGTGRGRIVAGGVALVAWVGLMVPEVGEPLTVSWLALLAVLVVAAGAERTPQRPAATPG